MWEQDILQGKSIKRGDVKEDKKKQIPIKKKITGKSPGEKMGEANKENRI